MRKLIMNDKVYYEYEEPSSWIKEERSFAFRVMQGDGWVIELSGELPVTINKGDMITIINGVEFRVFPNPVSCTSKKLLLKVE